MAIAIVAVFSPLLCSWLLRPSTPPKFAGTAVALPSAGLSQLPSISGTFISDAESEAVMAHSSTMAEQRDGSIRAVWFQGSREGGRDVSLYTSVLSPGSSKWSPPHVLIDRETASVEIGRRLKALGNPALFSAASGRTWLFFVTVSFFGWSGGNINFKYSDDSGQTWSAAKRLNISPAPHSGTLVRGTPFEYEDGSIGLPIYRSYDQYSYAELVRVNPDGDVLSRVTMSNGERGGLQPSVVTVDGENAVAFLRYHGVDPKRVLRVATSDAGRSWTSPVKLELPNPDSALASLRLSDGSLIMVFNNSTQYRNVMSLAVSGDLGATWKIVYTFDADDADGLNDVKGDRSYPSLLRTRSGDIHMLYTWNRQKIRHIIMNEAWVHSLND